MSCLLSAGPGCGDGCGWPEGEGPNENAAACAAAAQGQIHQTPEDTSRAALHFQPQWCGQHEYVCVMCGADY